MQNHGNKQIVFVVDDSDYSLEIAKEALSDRYRVLTMASAAKMFEILTLLVPDCILLDFKMPDTNGYDALRDLKKIPRFSAIPVIILTSTDDDEVEAEGFDIGAVDFIVKPFSTQVLKNRIRTHINTTEIIRNRTKHLLKLQNSLIDVISDLVESRDAVTGGHIGRTSRYLEILVNAMRENNIYIEEVSKFSTELIINSAKLHDVGKITVSDTVLNKPGRLTSDEFKTMQTHTISGGTIIDRIISETGEDHLLQHAKIFAECHHEKWDGTGYPRGLKGDEIPLLGRIMAVVDVYDALVSARPYKQPFTHEKAVKIIYEDSGTHFDPEIVRAFLLVADGIREAGKTLQQ